MMFWTRLSGFNKSQQTQYPESVTYVVSSTLLVLGQLPPNIRDTRVVGSGLGALCIGLQAFITNSLYQYIQLLDYLPIDTNKVLEGRIGISINSKAERSNFQTHIVPTTVIKMMVCGDSCDNLNACFLRCCFHFGDVVRVDRGCSVSGVIDEEVGVVVVTDRDREDLHFERSRGSEGNSRYTDRSVECPQGRGRPIENVGKTAGEH